MSDMHSASTEVRYHLNLVPNELYTIECWGGGTFEYIGEVVASDVLAFRNRATGIVFLAKFQTVRRWADLDVKHVGVITEEAMKDNPSMPVMRHDFHPRDDRP